MILNEEELKVFKHKLLNDHSQEEIEQLKNLNTEDIRDYIRILINPSIASGDYNILYMPYFTIIDELHIRLEKEINICKACEINKILKSLCREIITDEWMNELKKENLNGIN